ncbi:Auxin-responsive protein SAUR32 [Spatholobus suberectus]|nr:Auxin-responsive protein SAUR32 [Spatholobus suberectus]
MLRSLVGRIEKGLSLFVHRRPPLSYYNEATSVVSDDVREGYFAVLATKGGESKRFIVGLHYLNDPAFLGLLDQAQQEFGFRQKGALAIPCQPQELQKILDAWSKSIEQRSTKGAGNNVIENLYIDVHNFLYM